MADDELTKSASSRGMSWYSSLSSVTWLWLSKGWMSTTSTAGRLSIDFMHRIQIEHSHAQMGLWGDCLLFSPLEQMHT